MAPTGFGSKRWLALLGLAGVVIGCQALLGSALPKARFVVLLSDAPTERRVHRQFSRGFALGEESVRRCGAEMPPVNWIDLPDDQPPTVALRSHRTVQVVVAPPAADLRAFDQLAGERQLTVVLPYQRGSSLTTLRSLEHRHRLWPLTPSRDVDINALADAAMAAGWGRAMVVADPTALEATVSEQFVSRYRTLGGVVESYEADLVQRVDSADASSLKRFRDDMAWSWTQTVVVASDPKGALAQVLQHQQAEGIFGGGAPQTPNWVWLSESDRVATLRRRPWQQITLKAPARGDAWGPFAQRFQERWGEAPDLLAASAYDTARVLALAAGVDGDPLSWIDPDAEPMPLCEAFSRRQASDSEGLRIPSAASDFRLRPGLPPGGTAQAGLVNS
ncbi:MAG: amino acid ABC transporter substrate-binding protein [Synechococcus sp.]